MPGEIPLGGGDVTEGVVRVGDTVRRPVRESTPAVHALLRHLEEAGFEGAPRVLGFDERGREILTYVPGVTALRPMPAFAASDEALAELARLLRRYHDVVAGFTPPEGAVWEKVASNDDAAPELIGHCDVTPENVVFRGGSPYALIDFDMARPTTRLFDVVTTLRHWAPIAHPADRDAAQRFTYVGPRLRLFCDAYGLEDRSRLLDLVRLRFERSYEAMRERADVLGGAWARMWADGAGDRILRALDWFDRNRDRLDAAL
ncbi:phosphotransferase [Bailinhaonella thermotolerans]|uniref:phosphotransferase n=1 Tax=Bailinhaonella thermotolerans TaxID=1070861 RepID=UPI001F5B9AC0|nr:phosphotransferase [Bailinhaonella thermotolerans]